MNTIILSWVTFVYLAAFLFSMMSIGLKRRDVGRIAMFIIMAGFAAHTSGLVFRWVESYHLGIGHAPLANFYESLIFFSWTIVLLMLVIEYRSRVKELGVFAMPVAFLLMAYASFSPDIDSRIQPLIPALKSNWLVSHVITCFLGYAAFVIASVFSLMYLITIWGNWGSLPSVFLQGHRIEELIYRTLVFGYIMFTLGIVTGSVWAHSAWGSYWSWDPKETWALITWLIYTSTLHARYLGKNRGKRLAVMTLMGLGSVVFTYLGVQYLPGLHSYL